MDRSDWLVCAICTLLAVLCAALITAVVVG
jgi:hypothetical protein